jgi:hypothetical protein
MFLYQFAFNIARIGKNRFFYSHCERLTLQSIHLRSIPGLALTLKTAGIGLYAGLPAGTLHLVGMVPGRSRCSFQETVFPHISVAGRLQPGIKLNFIDITGCRDLATMSYVLTTFVFFYLNLDYVYGKMRKRQYA